MRLRIEVAVVTFRVWMSSQFLKIGKVEEAGVYEYAVNINMCQYPLFVSDLFIFKF